MVANTSWYIRNFHLPLLRDIQSQGLDVVVAAPEDESSRDLQIAGLHYRKLPLSRRTINPFVDLALLRRMTRMYREERPDYVFHHTIKPVIYGSIAARIAGVRHVTNLIPGMGYVFTGNAIIQKSLRPFVEFLYRRALRSTDMVLFLNVDDREYFVRRSLVSRERTMVTPGAGVDQNHFYFCEPRSTKNGNCTFLILGRLLWDKGFGDYVDAARIVRQRYPSARFQILGKPDPGNPSHVKEETLSSWVSSGTVEYLGERSDVRDVVAAADVVVLPSYYREGIPRSLLEAMAMGKPIITTDAPGCRETVVNGANGILVPVRNPPALAEAMIHLIQRPEQRAEMGREGRRIVTERFSVGQVNAMMLKAMGLLPGLRT